MSAWTCRSSAGKADQKIAPGADSEEKHEPVSDIDTAAADSLKVLDPKRPIREADMLLQCHLPSTQKVKPAITKSLACCTSNRQHFANIVKSLPRPTLAQ
jgi:hypothetical protein